VTLTPTSTRPPPTPAQATSTPPQTAVCLSAFQDSNGNGLHDNNEWLQPGVAFTVYTADTVIGNYITDGASEPHCLQVEPGNYQITRSHAANETLTSSGNQAILLNQGDVMYLTFGGQTGAEVPPTQPAAYPAVSTSEVVGNTAVVIGENEVSAATPSPSGGQPRTPISLIPLGAVIIGGLLLTVAVIFFARTRT
jgi:hypothetical protein